ncbi:hemicentin-2-like isoform X2 [Stylophora pistillata]|uniref:hemicentin-2-like isoform X2 n=1 Tax=Stylophora pistillata TaxID=50429 RepID=UPI000C0489ED|nr:hemicentin-2-like isoform X2 [Stylophora pistillata]
MTSSGERFAQILVMFWSLAVLQSAGGQSVTWYEPLPVETVSSSTTDLPPAEMKVFEGYPASLSWNFSLTSLTLFLATVRFDTVTLALSGPGGSGANVDDAFKDRFNLTWISQRLTLVIFNVTASYDASNGAFDCELGTNKGSWSRHIRLKIIEPTKIVGVTSDQDVCVDAKVTLSCNATGKPEPNITWTRVWENGTDSRALQSKDGYFVKDNFGNSSSGTYRCAAFNGVGEPVNQTVKVIAKYSVPKVKVVRSSNVVLEGNAYSLSCEATGDRITKFTWIKVSNNLSSDGHILDFSNIDRNDAGVYKCEASNRCGRKTKTETLIVSFKPDNVTLEMNTTENNGCNDLWVNFTCNSSEASPPVHNYLLLKNETEVSFNQKGTWIEKILQGKTFVYKCQAYQEIDNVTSTNIISLSVKEPPSVKQLKNEQVQEGRDVVKECDVTTGTPPLTFFWKKVNTSEVWYGKPLNITDINRNQSGEYRCFTNNTCGNDSTSMFIDVQFKPDNVTLERNTTENNSCTDLWVNLTCNSSEANPPVHNYVLIKNETDLIFSRKGTWIEKISGGETFVYKCQAYQQVDNVTSIKGITLNVNDLPVMEQLLNITVEEGGDVTKECNVIAGTPPPTVFWKNINTSEVIHGKLLNITDIRRNQSGEYRCFANNTCGNDSSTMFIDVQYPPNITRIMNDTEVNETDLVTLDCQANGDPSPVIRWIFVSNMSIVPETFRITGKQDEGFYRCIANNSVGNPSTRDVYITVLYYRPWKTKLMIDTADGFVFLNQIFTVECYAQANPPARHEIFRGDGTSVGNNSVVTTSVTEAREDIVNFTCKVSNAYGDGPTVMIAVGVFFAPPAINKTSPCKKYVKKGEETVLTCFSVGHPKPNITWTLRGEVQDSDGNYLYITPQETGPYPYKCKAENGIGNSTEATVDIAVENDVAPLLRYSMTYRGETFTKELNDKRSLKYKNLAKEVQKVKEAFPECHTPKRVVVEIISPNENRQVVVYCGVYFNVTMGVEAATSYLKDAAKEGKLGNVDADSITFVEAVTDRKRCMAIYNDDQLCNSVKDIWIAVFSVGGVTIVAVIGLGAYYVHKKRKCRRKDNSVHNENEEEQAFSSKHGTLSDGKPCDYAMSGPQPPVDLDNEQQLGAVPTYAVVDKSQKKGKKKKKEAAEQKPIDDQYAVVDKSKKKKKNEADNTYAEVDTSKKSKKKPKPSEVLYADLGEFHSMKKMPAVSTSPKALPPIKRPEAYVETQYADIAQFVKGNSEEPGAELPKGSTTPALNNTATGSKEESSAGNTGDGAKATNETGF